MGLHDWLGFYFQRLDALQNYWHFYIIVAIGITGFAAKAITSSAGRWVRWVLIAAFVLFAAGNWIAMERVVDQQHQLRELVLDAAQKSGESSDELTAVVGTSVGSTKLSAYHVATDLLVVAVLLAIPRKRGDDASA